MMCHCVTHFFTYLLPLEDVSTQAETETTTNVGSSTVVTSDGLNNNATTHDDYGLPPGTICNRFCYCYHVIYVACGGLNIDDLLQQLT